MWKNNKKNNNFDKIKTTTSEVVHLRMLQKVLLWDIVISDFNPENVL